MFVNPMRFWSFLANGARLHDRRRHRRVYGRPLCLEIDGNKYKTRDWSLGGFRLVGSFADAKVGDRVGGTIRVPGGAEPGPFTAEVVRLTEYGDVALRFLETSPRTFLAMSALKPC